MSYEKQTWQTGDTVTSAKLNHMEDGIAAGGGGGGGSVMKVTYTYDEGTDAFTSDKTTAEIISAFNSGCYIFAEDADSPGVVFSLYNLDEEVEEVVFNRLTVGLLINDKVSITQTTFRQLFRDGEERVVYDYYSKDVAIYGGS